MKSSFDYFKTLKDMSGCIGRVYSSADRPDLYKKEMLFYNSIRKELSLKLSREFVAPIERNDIYNLSSFLSREMLVLDYICQLTQYVKSNIDNDILSYFGIQGDAMYRLGNRKIYTELIDEMHDIQSRLSVKRRDMWSLFRTSFHKSDNALIRYIFFDKTIRLMDCLSDTLCEIERVVINNL